MNISKNVAVWRWDSGCVVFDRHTGDTHLIEGVMFDASVGGLGDSLEILQSGEMLGIDQIATHRLREYDVPPNP